jgi:ribosomal protein S18 acetylase RimI-like enzyme
VIDFERARATERRALSAICSFTAHGDYLVCRSERFPGFYSGNALEFSRLAGRGLTELEELFAACFAPRDYEHRAFCLPDTAEGRALCEEALRRGYRATRSVYLFTDRPAPRAPLPAQLALRRVDDRERWSLLEAFFHELSRGEDWYGSAQESGPLFERARAASQAIGMEWHYIGPAERDEMWARLGLFAHRGVCRLQDVGTLPEQRRKGLATQLLGHAIALALQRGAGLVVCADEGYSAIDLYRRLGFRDLGCSIDLLWYEAKPAAQRR